LRFYDQELHLRALCSNNESSAYLPVVPSGPDCHKVIKFRGPAIRMAGNPLRGFKSAVIFQKIRDAGRPE
jgi:hypothetical protein